MKNFLWTLSRPLARSGKPGAVAILAAAWALSDIGGAGQGCLHAAAAEIPVQIYASADDTSLAIGTLATRETATPIAEIQGAGGKKWYLIKSRSGVVGWIKQGDSEQSSEAQRFFRSLPPERGALSVQVPRTSAANAGKNTATAPIAFIDGAIVVPVTLNGTVTANLLLDTGASMTMISRRLASNLALPVLASGLVSGIGGTVNAPIARLESIKVGDAELGGMRVSIHDIPRFEGLLGMDFLGRFHISVDPNKGLLVLAPK